VNTNKRFQDMCQMRDDGKTINEIAAHYGITKQRVSQIFRSHDKPLKRRVSDGDILTGTPEIVAQRYGLKTVSIVARMKKLGITFPHKPYTRSIWPIERVMTLYEDYLAGMTQEQIACKYGIHQTTVSTVFRRNGLKTNGRGGLKGKPRK